MPMIYKKKLCPFGLNVEDVDISTKSKFAPEMLKFHVFAPGVPGLVTCMELYNNLNVI
jgi:hypothetical protein